ncbi:hypothetical protein [Prochlorococcus marinus]|nr:hypothetical protein [Prochlorococcus marinus]
MDSQNQSWKLWAFVFCLNIIAFGGALYLKSIGIDLYAFRGSS